MSSKPKVAVRVVSDLLWPWCYIGKASLDIAIAEIKDEVDVLIVWEPYLMRNDVPPEGRPLIPAGAEPQFRKNFGERARKLGIDMTGDVTRVPNTLLLHVCLHWAYTQEPTKQHSLKGLIFQAYYSKNIFLNAENLAVLAGQAGYDADAALAHLLSGNGEAEIKQRSDQAKQSGINGIPYFMINDKPAFSGAQDPAKFKEVLLQNAR